MFKYSRNGVSVLVVLDRRRAKKSGLYPVKVEVVYRRRQKYYPTGQDMSETEWMCFPARTSMEVAAMIDDRFYRVKTEVDIMLRNGSFSFASLGTNLGKGAERTVNEMLSSMMEEFRTEGRVNSYYRCRSTLKSIERFAGNDIPLSDITPHWLKSCEAFWRGEGKSATTVSIYMKTLKSIVNRAFRDGLVGPNAFPYGRGRYVVPAGNGRKRALSRSAIRRIIDYKGEPRLEESRDLWLFSYLCNGINFMDMLYLKYGNVVGNEIWFVRSKTKGTMSETRQIRAVFTDEMHRIVARWGNADDGNPDTFLFRYASPYDDAFAAVSKVRRVTSMCNRGLAKIASEIGIPKFTTYSARHSFASVLKWSGVDIAFISESLGHSSLSITEHYLAGSGEEERRKRAKILTDLNPGKSRR